MKPKSRLVYVVTSGQVFKRQTKITLTFMRQFILIYEMLKVDFYS